MFYIQPRGGITGRLATAAIKQPGVTFPVLIDGPYGGVKTRPIYSYDRGLVVACGAGAGFAIPFIVDFLLKVNKLPQSETAIGRRRLQVLICTRDEHILDWFEDGLEELLTANGLPLTLDDVEVSIHITSEAGSPQESSLERLPPSPQESEKSNEKKVLSSARSARKLPVQILNGRPDITEAVRGATLENGVTVGIAACGPASVLRAVQDEAAEAQLRILKSRSGASEVYLHSEVFS